MVHIPVWQFIAIVVAALFGGVLLGNWLHGDPELFACNGPDGKAFICGVRQ